MVNFLEVCDIQGGTQPPKKDWSLEKKEGFVRMLQIRDFTQNREGKDEYVKDKSTLKKCTNADILIGRYGASIGKILTGLEGAYNVAIVKTIPDSKRLEKKYLYYFLNTKYFQNFIQNAGSRAAQAGFNKAELRDLQIPLPPIPIQKAIAEKLDKADALRKKDKELLAQYDELSQAVFIDMFGDPVRNERGWEITKLEKLCDITSSKRIFQNEYVVEGIPFFRTKEIVNLANGESIKTELYISRSRFEEIRNKFDVPTKGDVLISAVGTIGVMWIVDDRTFYFKDGNLIWLKSPKIQNEFLTFFINKKIAALKDRMAEGAAYTALTIEKLKQLEILLPPPDLLQKFGSVIKNIEQQKAIVKQQAQQSEDLFQALLQESFNFN